jgi:ectoine hydroxylase-related dioxygenase (phytanoyl-CoA dioxygenase family)
MKTWPGRAKPHRVYEIRDPNALLQRCMSPVRVTCHSGDALFFNMLTVHKSEPNGSADIRWTIQYRYYSALSVAEAKLDRSRLERR